MKSSKSIHIQIQELKNNIANQLKESLEEEKLSQGAIPSSWNESEISSDDVLNNCESNAQASTTCMAHDIFFPKGKAGVTGEGEKDILENPVFCDGHDDSAARDSQACEWSKKFENVHDVESPAVNRNNCYVEKKLDACFHETDIVIEKPIFASFVKQKMAMFGIEIVISTGVSYAIAWGVGSLFTLSSLCRIIIGAVLAFAVNALAVYRIIKQ